MGKNEKGGGGKGRQAWRPGIELGNSKVENLRKCHKNNSSNNDRVTLRPCELLELMGKNI